MERRALRDLQIPLAALRNRAPLHVADCAAIEDSVHGVLAAQRAGLSCLAVTTSLPPARLNMADGLISDLADCESQVFVHMRCVRGAKSL